MEQNPTLNNPSFNFSKALGSIVVISTLATGIAVVASVDNETLLNAPANIYSNEQSLYGLLDLKIVSLDTGKAIINLDGQRVFVTFEFDHFVENNGLLGGDTVAIDIKELKEIRVLDKRGKEVSDNTTFDDHRNMISVITAHIHRNKMIEVAS